MNTRPLVPMGSEYTTLSSDNYTVYTGASSSIYITSALTTEFPVEYTSDNNTQYVYRKHAFRTPKKKKGDLVDVNNPRHRIKNLLKPIVVFKFLKEGFKPIERKNLSNRLEKACQILESTSITNQIALREKIQAKFGKFLREQEMIACGFTMFLEREILQTFVDSVREKVVKITPIKNYVRLIPKEVKAKMEIAQERRLFDDYVVIHCDPENKAVEKTIEEKKDPILCGVIKESSRYYFVGDWMDEICDITMDSLLEHLGLDEEDVSLPNDVETALLEIL